MRDRSDRSATRSWIAVLLLTLAASLALPAAAPARGTSTGTEKSLVARVAAQLEKSPVVVHPPYDTVIRPADERRLVRKIKATGKPIVMALVPLVQGDQFDAEARNFVTALRDRMGRDGIFVAVEDRYLRAFEYEQGQSAYGAADDAMELANHVSADNNAYKRTPLERAELFLDYVQLPPAELEKKVEAHRDEQRERVEAFQDEADGEGSAWGVLLLLGTVIVLVVWYWRSRRRRAGARPAVEALPVLPDRVFEHARAAQRANLREDADQELLKLSSLLDAQPMPKKPAAQEAYQRALDAYAAARRRTGTEAPVVDLVGALVLVDGARSDLAAATAIDAGRKPAKHPALCVFDPLHGRAARDVQWQHGNRRLRVPACAACAEAVRRRRDPDALRDGDVPYFEADTVWARTGFGAFDDDLLERVARGER